MKSLNDKNEGSKKCNADSTQRGNWKFKKASK